MAQRKPTAVLEMRGAFKDNPSRKRDRAGEPTDFTPLSATPPKHLTAREKKVWIEYMGYFPPGIIASMDMLVFETMIILYTKFRDRKTREKMTPSEVGNMLRCAITMGLTPTERSKLIQNRKPGSKTGWDGL